MSTFSRQPCTCWRCSRLSRFSSGFFTSARRSTAPPRNQPGTAGPSQSTLAAGAQALSSRRAIHLTENGHGRYQTEKVRVAIVGVGNCASAFVQGVEYYKDADPAARVPGLMHVDLGGYHVSDIEFTAAFDIDSEKVGKDLSEAIWSGQNNTIKFSDVPKLGVTVQRGMTHDGLGKYLSQKITKAPGPTDDIVQI